MPQFCVNNEVSSSLSLRMAMYSCALTRPSSGSLFFFVLFVLFFWGGLSIAFCFHFKHRRRRSLVYFVPPVDCGAVRLVTLHPHTHRPIKAALCAFIWLTISHPPSGSTNCAFILHPRISFFYFRCNTCVCFNSFLFAPHFSFVMEENKRAHGAYPTISFI